MPALSPTLTEITGGGSDGWEVFMRAREMIAAGTPVTELTIGEHDIRTDPIILDAMHASACGGHTGYAMVPGIAALRREVAQRVQERTGVPTGPENVMITPGGQSALFASHLATCPKGKKALFIDPYYATYPGTLRAVGAIATPIEADAKGGFQPRAADIEVQAEGATSLLINSPNNPTGVVYTRNTLDGIAEVCKRRDLWLISDEVYDTQIWEGVHISPRALPDMAERTLVIGSMSKSHAMTGSRVGWIVGPRTAIEHLINLATHTTYGVAGFVQDAALFALEQGPALEAEIAAPFKRRRALTVNILAEQNVVKMISADGAMYVMLDIRATGLSGEAFANRLLDEHHIAVMPGESFGRAAAGHLRVAMTIEDTAYAAALRALCAFAAALCE
ncbi:MAG: aminotransferase class I/II-fold pyridoxal phosphate-dependent enzyme [Planktotalea sp.]|uniref:pyridoxal phosphate-dependent aminotransferase n=1 Tax=Planktotalea sp. TaxID=2029877 RepID=UPI0026050822|nr:aminotransferase class I/II-fold pyridoxal phosphate-dependent enzyme [Planktotalea sp.]MDG1077271.1 aminotransferase class I/II-fold pyridoxal phosphate-dependent enzyme [Planktotalea sp.]